MIGIKFHGLICNYRFLAIEMLLLLLFLLHFCSFSISYIICMYGWDPWAAHLLHPSSNQVVIGLNDLDLSSFQLAQSFFR